MTEITKPTMREEGSRIVLATVVAAIAGFAALFLLPNILPTDSPWSVPLSAFIVAGAWMSVGLLIARRTSAAGPIIFLPGAVCAYFFARGVVHSVSPWYGLIEFFSACLGAAIAGALLAHRRARLFGFAFPIATGVLISVLALCFAPQVLSRSITRNDGSTGTVLVFFDSNPRHGGYVIDPEGSNSDVLVRDSVRIEMDPGSGNGSYRLERMVSEADIMAACDAMKAFAESLLVREVARGSTAQWITRIPARAPRCRADRLWRIVQQPG
ncbi:MAG: hypothetical protein ACO1Q7_11000 [Gemmatimonas sp.]